MFSDDCSAISELEVFLNNQHKLLQSQFDPRDIGDDWQAKAILNRMYSMIINPNYIINTGSDEISHTRAEFNFTINAEFDLFIFMVLTNRASMARLFWIRDGRKRTATMFQSALLACLLSRGLIKLPCVSQHYHLVTAFAHIADEYEEFVATVLKRAHARNTERTLSAMNRRFQQCRHWNALDVIVQANCIKLVETCDSLCVEAVKRRFFGTFELSSSIPRLALAWTAVVEEFYVKNEKEPNQTAVFPGAQGVGNASPFKGAGKRFQKSDSSFNTDLEDKSGPVGVNVWAFLTCICVDFIGALRILSAVIPFPLGLFTAPATGALVYFQHRSAPLAVMCLAEECVPYVNLLPSASITWWWIESARWMDRDARRKAEEAAHRIFLPIDYFIIDVLSHLIVTSLITGFMLIDQSFLSIALEGFIVILLLADEIPDVLFAGIRKDSPSMLSVVVEGFKEYISSTGCVCTLSCDPRRSNCSVRFGGFSPDGLCCVAASASSSVGWSSSSLDLF